VTTASVNAIDRTRRLVIQWPQPPGNWALEEREVQVWAAPLEATAEGLDKFARTLAPEEHERAGRFLFDRDRERFVVGRGLLRAILGRYLGAEPAEIALAYGPHGKPTLDGAFAGNRLAFNVAHSAGLAVVAVARDCVLGVDVERVRDLGNAAEMADRFFSPRESAELRALPDDQRPAAFIHLWTRKEAFLKATGRGIAEGLEIIEVSFLPEEPARLISVPETAEHLAWELHDLKPAAGFGAALALGEVLRDGAHEAGKREIKCWRWVEERAFSTP